MTPHLSTPKPLTSFSISVEWRNCPALNFYNCSKGREAEWDGTGLSKQRALLSLIFLSLQSEGTWRPSPSFPIFPQLCTPTWSCLRWMVVPNQGLCIFSLSLSLSFLISLFFSLSLSSFFFFFYINELTLFIYFCPRPPPLPLTPPL